MTEGYEEEKEDVFKVGDTFILNVNPYGEAQYKKFTYFGDSIYGESELTDDDRLEIQRRTEGQGRNRDNIFFNWRQEDHTRD
jgi:hypothetical protein